MTPNPQSKSQRIFQTDWVLAGLLLIIFLLANGYTYAWDDQHVEIPLLKSLIDPSLYPNDYYVTSLKKNFTSVLYPILAKLITIDQIPTAYFILYLLSRYFFFYWMYKFWRLVAPKRRGAFLCVLTTMLLGRVEEFLYRTFSHQEFALAIVMAGFYFFYKERFFLAALLLGVAANFHALYSLFPMLYMLTFLLWEHKKFGWRTFFNSGIIFAAFTSPFLIWTTQKYLHAAPAHVDLNWMSLYLLACPQNFTFLEIPLQDMLHNFQKFVTATDSYFFLLLMFVFNILFHSAFRKDPKAKAILSSATALLFLSFIFSYIFPVRFIIDLNLIRNAQYLLFILVGYTTLLVLETLQEKNILVGLLTLLAFTLIRFGDTISCLAILLMICFLAYSALDKNNTILPRTLGKFILIILIGFTTGGIVKMFVAQKFSLVSIRSLQIIAGLLTAGYLLNFALKNPRDKMFLKNIIIFIPYLLFLINFGYYHYRHLQIEKRGGGFWQMQRNWIDLQHYVKNNTPKNALFLIPHDMEMGGFRIFSERPIVMEYRDCGIVGFDYAAAAEWRHRLKEFEHFKILIDGPFEPAIKTAISKYRVNYIVFMGYLNPANSAIMEKVYQNEVFALYQIKVNPVQ